MYNIDKYFDKAYDDLTNDMFYVESILQDVSSIETELCYYCKSIEDPVIDSNAIAVLSGRAQSALHNLRYDLFNLRDCVLALQNPEDYLDTLD